ncbi:MAG: sulfatase-like hydrolase/transferase [Planctomycetota bacterium]|nr:sulfatase-like hydrolase/transferase [Planctomycetota bacterium]MDA1213350.1 sulfatase-like hydrolase/transferase [Planctomycetota bacterium]
MNSHILHFVIVLLLLIAPLPANELPSPPNILILYVDNLGYGDLGCYGNDKILSPRIDTLAAEGVRCTDFYTAAPSCSPSRGALLTGRHPLRNGLNHQLSPDENLRGEGLPQSETLIPQYLHEAGYVCGAFGKWNIGFAPGSRPTERGFDEFFGHASGNIHYFKHLYHNQNDLRQGTITVDRRGEYATDLFADAAIDFMKRHHDRPWLVYLPFNAVHFVSSVNVEEGEEPSWQVPGEYLERYGYDADETDEQKRFHAVVTSLDDAVGRVIDRVDELGLKEKTFVLFISDNGAFMLKDRGLEVQSNKPLRDGGVTTYEGGIRVPAILCWPGTIPPGTVCDNMLSTLDVLPTLLTLSGIETDDEIVFDGIDMLPLLKREATDNAERTMHWVWNQGRRQNWEAMRRGEWKIVRQSPEQPWELYDLTHDIGETKNLSAEHPEHVKELAMSFTIWQTGITRDDNN